MKAEIVTSLWEGSASWVRESGPAPVTALVAIGVGFQLGTSLLHGVVHATIPVVLPSWQYGVVAVSLLLAPLVGLGLVATSAGYRTTGNDRRTPDTVLNRETIGIVILGLAGLSGLAFEVIAHFLVENPDHVGTVDHGGGIFAVTAVLSILGDLCLVLLAGWLLAHRQGSSTSSASESTT